MREAWVRSTERVLVRGAGAFCAAWAATSLTFPFGWDHGLMAAAGDVILQGGMPYRDAWEMKGPIVYLWFAAAQAIFGKGQLGIRVLDLALMLWAAIALGRVGARLTRPSAGPWITIALILAHGSLTYFHTAQPDGAAAFAMIIAFAPLIGAPATRRETLVAAAVVGLCALVKPPYLVYLAIPLFAHVATFKETPLQRLGTAFLLLVMALVPVALVLAWFAARGALADLVDIHIRYTALSYSGAATFEIGSRLAGLGRYFGSGPHGIALVFAAFGGLAAWRRDRRVAALLVAWLLAGLALVVMQGKFFVYHWTAIVPPMILLAAAGLTALLPAPVPRSAEAPRRDPGLRMLAWVATAAILTQLAAQPVRDAINVARLVTLRDTPIEYADRFALPGAPFSPAEQIAAARYINEHTRPTDQVAVFGYDAPALYLSCRKNATRFSYALPIASTRSTAEVTKAYRREFLDGLASRPAYIIVGLLFPRKDRVLEDFPEFTRLLATGYTLDRSFGTVDLYRRNEAGPVDVPASGVAGSDSR